MPHKKEKKTPPKKESKPKQHAYYVCDGGTCTCDGATAPTNPVPIKVTSHSKYYILGGTKLIATDKDNTNQNLDFKTCKNVPPNSSPQPCKAKLKIKWDKFYKDVTYDKDHKHPLLDISQGTCNGYSGKPANIKVSNHGQTGHATQKEIETYNQNIFNKWFPLVPAEEPVEKNEAPAVESISLLNDGNLLTSPIQSGADGSKVTKKEIEMQEKDVALQFRARVKSGNPQLVNWNEYGVKSVADKVPSYDNVFVSYLEYGEKFSVKVPARYKGIFRVEAFGFSPGDESCSLDIEFCPNEISSITGITKGLVGKPITFSAAYKFKHPGLHVNWKITYGKTEVYNSLQPDFMHGSISSILQNIPFNNNNQMQFNFANKGKYTVTAFDTAQNTSKTLEVEIFASQEVLQLRHNAEMFLRDTDLVQCEIAGFNIDSSLVNKNSIEWRVYYAANGQKPSKFYGEVMNSRGQLKINCTPKQLQQSLHLPTANGCYKIEVYGEHPTQQSTAGNRYHVENYTFEVKDNCVTASPAGPPQVPAGCTGTYKAETLMPLVTSEKNAFVWEITGGEYTIEPSNHQTQEVKITFADQATYTIKCHLQINGVNTGTKETTVTVAPMRLYSANWCYNDGYIRTQTGYEEDCYAYVEISGVQAFKGKLQVWLTSDGLDMATVVKDQNYLIEEYDLTLTADENRHPATAHGYITFKPEKNKIPLACLPTGAIPKFAFTITPDKENGGINFGTDILIEQTTQLVANNKRFYAVLSGQQQYLSLTSEQIVKAIYFSDKEKKKIQIGSATYGETHQIRVHTVNLAKEKLTVRAYRENPNALLDAAYDPAEQTMVIAEMVQEYKDQQPWPDGSLMLDFTLKQEWKTQHKSETLRLFTAEVFKSVTDPATKKTTLQLIQSQYRSKDGLPFNLLRNNSQVCVQITDKNAPADKDSLEQYKHQYLTTSDALFVVKDLAGNKEPQPSPTLVYFEDLEVEEGGEWKCECEEKLRAFMRMIRKGEGTIDESGYNRIVGGSTFAQHGKDLSTHPMVYIKEFDSTAAGAYQITKKNWNGIQFSNWRVHHNITDFKPESQDVYAAYLIIMKRNAFDSIQSNDFEGAVRRCSSEWASLPGAGYGQREEKIQTIKKLYDKFLNEELKGHEGEEARLHIEQGFLNKYFGNICSCGQNKKTAKKGYDIVKAVAALNRNVLSKSASKCAKYVRMAIEAGGLSTNGRPVPAKNYDTFLPRLGFNEVNTAGYTPLKGDIIVIQSIPGHPYGHICMYNGAQWVSDFRQIDMWPAAAYRENPPRYNIFRWK